MASLEFSDYASGEHVVTTARHTVTEAHVVGWAGLTGDWHPLHTDDTFAQEDSEFGTRVAHGPLVFALAIGLVERTGILGRSVIAWLGVDKLRATAPVRFGDTVQVDVSAIEARLTSKPNRGVVRLLYTVSNQFNVHVMTFEWSLLYHMPAQKQQGD